MRERHTNSRASSVWERWDEVDRLFDAALDLPVPEREAFLVEACGDDLELLNRVSKLLGSTDTAAAQLTGPGTSLMRAAWSQADATQDITPALQPGEHIGRYRIVAELGRGGMATVYEAERADGTFQRRVALKVIRRGVDTDDAVGRFLAERQILSGLTHPNIARLLDGGADDDGRPYLIMDHVAGEPITAFAERHGLTIPARLRLFLQVADAVHYAHQRLVVHRDIKPSNVLVTAEGQAKLLDFGIAKLLGADADETAHTRVGARPLTPQYASPEQLRGEAVTTASDVYQLGILLHVLLTGVRPQDGPIPAGVRRTLRGDLETVLQQALRSEPEQRYDSAQALAADVRRHLDGLPIAARPASLGYSFGKFVARNRWFSPVAALVLVLLIGFGAARVRHERQLERERNEAHAQAQRADQLKDFLIGLFGSADPWSPADPERGRAITVVEALAVGAERARTELADRALLRADLLSTIASVYEGLDQPGPALALLNEVIEVRQQSEAAPSRAQLNELGRRAALLDATAQTDSAAALFHHLLELERTMYGSDHPQRADVLVSFSNQLARLGDHQAAAEARLEAVRIFRAGGAATTKQLADALALTADTYRQLQLPDAAERAAREALEIHRELYGDEHPSTSSSRVHLAQVEHARGRLDEAIRLYREALPVLERALGPDHFHTINSWNNLGIVLMEAEDFTGAEDVHRRILAHRIELAGGDDVAVAASLQNLAVTLVRQRRYDEAESLTVRARDIYRTVLPPRHALHAFPLLTQSEIQLLRGDGAAAEASARSAVATLQAALPAGHYATAAAECRLGAAISDQARLAEAEPLLRTAFDKLEQNEMSPDRLIRECAAALAALHDATGRAAEAQRYRDIAGR